MTVYLFPGQGSQHLGMGKELFAEFPEIIEQADKNLGFSIIELCLEDKHEKLNETEYTQPLLYVINTLFYLKAIKERQTKPHYLAGHSLGEYNALYAAGVFDFESGLKLVQKRGQLMSKVRGGGMAAILGFRREDIESILESNHLQDICIANYNSYTQHVLSGSKDSIQRAEQFFTNGTAKVRYIPLKVSGAFHSFYLNEVQQQFADFLKTITFLPPKIPVIANIDAKAYSDNVHDSLDKQLNHSVQWLKTVEYFLAMGETEFIELGPGKVLSQLIAQIKLGK